MALRAAPTRPAAPDTLSDSPLNQSLMDCHHLGGIAWMVWDHMSEPIVARRASAGLVTRLVIAPRGSETMSATAVAVSLTHWVAEEKPDLI